MRFIEVILGKAISLKEWGKYTHLTIRNFGVHMIFGKTRSGKSTIIKNVLCQFPKYPDRRVVIIDPYSEYGLIRFPNFKSKGKIGSFANVKVLKNFGFYMKDFTAKEFSALGVPRKTAELLSELINLESLHGGDPETLYELLEELPQNKKELVDWNNNYPEFKIRAFIPSPIYQAINNGFLSLMPYFLSEKSTRVFIDFKEELKRGNIIVDFNITDRSSKHLYKILAGIVLERLMDLNPIYHTVYIIDEIDTLAPNSDFVTPVHDNIVQIAIKQQRQHIVLIGISQHPHLVTRELIENYHSFATGKMTNAGDIDLKDVVKKLNWDLNKNIRQFCLIDMDGKYQIFEPMEPMCLT